jgi:hypothetical protein
MGGILSSQTQTVTVTEVPPTQTTVEESKPTDTVQTTPTETTTNTVINSVDEPVAPSLTDNSNEVLERYIEKPGTKVEVVPVDVAPADDVVKKTKKKNKNKNKSKQETQN